MEWEKNGMSQRRYIEIEANKSQHLTEEEKAAGWHFCKEWDFMLIHKSWPEAEACLCEHPDC